MDAIISLREVTKRFRETVALDKVTVDFEAGKIHGIVGRNGSGKTVLMRRRGFCPTSAATGI